MQTKLLKFDDLVKYSTAIVLYKAFNKLLPPNLQRFFITPVQAYDLRGLGCFSVPRAQNTHKRFCASVCVTTQAMPNCTSIQIL